MSNRLSNRKFNDKIFEDFFVSNGMIHLGYKATTVADIVNRFYIDGFEMVNSSFAGWYENFLPYFPKDKAIVLEISGAEFKDEEKTVIENAIWYYYHDQLARTKKHIRSDIIKETWMLVSFIVSCVFLFFSRMTDLSILQDQYAAVPFWFFGYRVLTFWVLDIVPLVKDKRMIEQMASMKVVFSGINPTNEVPTDKVEQYTKEILEDRKNTIVTDYRYIRDKFFMDGNKATFLFHVESIEDLVPTCNIKGFELAEPEFFEYLHDLTDFCSQDAEIDIHFKGTSFSEDEKDTVKRSMKNFCELSIGNLRSILRDNYKRVLFLSICLLISSVLMRNHISFAGTVTAETIYLLFWFFADYLFEYIILDPIDSFKDIKKLKQIEKANLIFDE